MLEKIKSGFLNLKAKPKKENRFESKRKDSNYLIFSIVFGAILGFVVSYYSKNIFLFALFIISIPLLVSLLIPSSVSNKNKSKEKRLKQVYLNFYYMFLNYSSLYSSYQDGFKKTIEALDISDLKDNLIAYNENPNKGKLPLILTNSRIENNLSDMVSGLLNETEETSFQSLDDLSLLIAKYKGEDEEKKDTDFSFLLLIPFSMLLISLAFSFVQFSS